MKCGDYQLSNNDFRGRLAKIPNRAEEAVDRDAREKTQSAVADIAKAFSKREQPYQPIGKALSTIGIQPRVIPLDIGDETMDCLVIPIAELMMKEWVHMGGGFPVAEQPNEGEVND